MSVKHKLTTFVKHLMKIVNQCLTVRKTILEGNGRMNMSLRYGVWNMDHVVVIYSKSQLQPNRRINKLINCIVKLPRGLNIIFIWTKFSYKIGCSLNL